MKITHFAPTTFQHTSHVRWQWKKKEENLCSESIEHPKLSTSRAPTSHTQYKDQTENAIWIQAWYRGVRDTRIAKVEMWRAFEADVMGLTYLRCLVLIGKNDTVLGKGSWNSAQVRLFPFFDHECAHVQKNTSFPRWMDHIAQAGWY